MNSVLLNGNDNPKNLRFFEIRDTNVIAEKQLIAGIQLIISHFLVSDVCLSLNVVVVVISLSASLHVCPSVSFSHHVFPAITKEKQNTMLILIFIL